MTGSTGEGVPAADAHRDVTRLEAFSDGVFAIAITLLVLDLKVPRDLPAETSLASALMRQWPAYLAFLGSFATIGVMSINHHQVFTHIRQVDQALLLANLLLLLGVSVVPFSTALLAAQYDQTTAGVVYSGIFVLISLSFTWLWRYARTREHLLREGVDRTAVAAINRQFAFGPFPYLACFGIAFFNVSASVAANFLLAGFFALPPHVAARSLPKAAGRK